MRVKTRAWKSVLAALGIVAAPFALAPYTALGAGNTLTVIDLTAVNKPFTCTSTSRILSTNGKPALFHPTALTGQAGAPPGVYVCIRNMSGITQTLTLNGVPQPRSLPPLHRLGVASSQPAVDMFGLVSNPKATLTITFT